MNLQHARETGRFWRGFTLRESVDSKHSRRIPIIDLKNRRTFTLFTTFPDPCGGGKLGECSNKSAPIIEK